jgi:hypothetical protein
LSLWIRSRTRFQCWRSPRRLWLQATCLPVAPPRSIRWRRFAATEHAKGADARPDYPPRDSHGALAEFPSEEHPWSPLGLGLCAGHVQHAIASLCSCGGPAPRFLSVAVLFGRSEPRTKADANYGCGSAGADRLLVGSISASFALKRATALKRAGRGSVRRVVLRRLSTRPHQVATQKSRAMAHIALSLPPIGLRPGDSVRAQLPRAHALDCRDRVLKSTTLPQRRHCSGWTAPSVLRRG